MPMTGSTRMLRARRKDCNLKPNRRLDRKSSRGMLFENEELRMRTITINAEVEQGQHALKKLRRENEQLRREMWSLRDEYDKMEKLLRKKETDDDSNQENSDTEESPTDADSADEKLAIKEAASQQDETPTDLENDDRKPGNFGNEATVRTFDGLSVIDEQTEETQTTESPLGYGTSSRGDSANRTFSPSGPMYDEACGIAEFPQYGFVPPGKSPPKKKGISPPTYENGIFPATWTAADTYEQRPASPYPCNGSHHQDSYQKRFQVLQNLSVVPPPPTADGRWICPDPAKLSQLPEFDIYVNQPFEGAYLQEKPGDLTPGNPVLPSPDFPYNLIQDRTGPDVFVTDGYPSNTRPTILEGIPPILEKDDTISLDNLDAKLESIKISQKAERDPTTGGMTSLTKSIVSRDAFGSGKNHWDCQDMADGGKLTIDERAGGQSDSKFPKNGQPLVTCQDSYDRDVREKYETTTTAAEAPEPRLRSTTDEMQQCERSGGGGGGGSKYQTKLTVTLKTPGIRHEGKILSGGKPMGLQQRTFHDHQHQLLPRSGVKPEFSPVRFQTFPNAGCQAVVPRMSGKNARDCLVNHYAGVRGHANGLSGSLPKLPGLIPKPEPGSNASHIPVQEFHNELDVLHAGEESLSGSAATAAAAAGSPLLKPVKIPPVPPPRTSSCPKTIIPATLLESSTVHQRICRKGKSTDPNVESVIYNPLLLSQPIATSSPTISFRATKYGGTSSSENLYLPRCSQKQNYYDESSTEDLTKQKFKFREEMNLSEGPKLNKSVSSPSFETFRTFRRKHGGDTLAVSVENILAQRMPEVVSLTKEKHEKKQASSKGQSNVSVSSSSGLDSPIKSDRRKRRVSIQFKKKQAQQNGSQRPEEEKESTSSRRNSLNLAIASVKSSAGDKRKSKGKNDETDATTSERERTNSVSSRTSSLVAVGGGSRRKFSTSSNRTYLNEEKIPWCGCWGNGCV